MGRKKVAEDTSTLDAQNPVAEPGFEAGVEPEAGSLAMELVDEGGSLKRISFDADPVPEAPVTEPVEEPAPAPAVEEPETVRAGVDRLRRPDPEFAGAPRKANLDPWQASVRRTVYRTERGGEVRSYESSSGRTYALAGEGEEERRFRLAEVDRVISDVHIPESEPQQEEVVFQQVQAEEPKPKKGFLGGLFGKKKKGAAPAEPASDYQPQCSALTDEGAQCRNSAREGSKYCSSHKGYQPRTAEGIHASLDTEPRYESTQDTLPGAWEPGHHETAQCTALTNEGVQCQNPSMADSPFCGSHQYYTPPEAHEIVEHVDTAPRWEGAPDTLVATRKPSRPRRARTAKKAPKKAKPTKKAPKKAKPTKKAPKKAKPTKKARRGKR